MDASCTLTMTVSPFFTCCAVYALYSPLEAGRNSDSGFLFAAILHSTNKTQLRS